MAEYIDIVFDGPPGPESGRFVEVELPNGEGVRIGEWIALQDVRFHEGGWWVLRIGADEIASAGGEGAVDEFTPGRWWRIMDPSGRLWMETSDGEEARAEAERTGWPLERQFIAPQPREWRRV